MIQSDFIVRIEQIIGKVNTIEALAEQGCTSVVNRLVTADGIYILKSATTEQYRDWLRVEAKRMEHNNIVDWIPLPRFFGFFEEASGSHLLMSFEKGISLTVALQEATIMEKKALIRSFGRFLQYFHARNPVEALKCSGDWLEGQLEKARGYVEQGLAEGDLALLESLILRKPAPILATMIHGDCTTDNVLVMDGKVYLFIDAAGMTVGDPRYDESLATRRFRHEPELLDAFYEGYTRYRVTEEEQDYFYNGLYAFF